MTPSSYTDQSSSHRDSECRYSRGSQARSRKLSAFLFSFVHALDVGPTALKQTAIQSGEKHVCYHQCRNSLPFFSFEAIIAILLFDHEYVHKSIETDVSASVLKKSHTEISAIAA
jgi:hypothetical protein